MEWGTAIDLAVLRQLAIAGLMGLLVGAEREFSAQEEETRHFAGVRTFPIIGLVGAVAAHLTIALGVWVFVMCGLLLSGLLVASHLVEARTRADIGITTEMAAAAVFMVGALAARGEEQLAVILGVTITLLLSLKPFFARVRAKVQREDIAATLKFCIVAFVVLPLLPDASYGPFGGFNPRTIWKFVVLVSAIGFAGYVAVKVAGARRGLVLTALLGGLVSSTAVTATFSARSKEHAELANVLTVGIVIASVAKFIRLAAAMAVWNPALLPSLALPLGVMGGVTAVGGAWAFLRARRDEGQRQPVEVKNPFELSTALKFGGIVALVVFAARAGQAYLGDTGIYVSGVLSGVGDVDAITLTMAEMARDGHVAPVVAARTVTLAAMTNTAVKGGMALFTAAPAVGRAVAMIFLAALAAGAITLLFVR